ncbi:MAG: 50S ribosomal protein L22 [Calditrichia bacterium]
MEAIAKSRYIRMSPFKMRRVIELVKGKNVEEAINILHFTRKRAAKPVEKTLRSAVANLYQNEEAQNVALHDVVIKNIYVDQGPMLKRWRPMSKVVRPGRIRRRMSHLTIIVEAR